jgi:hypothetical protein
LLREPEAPPKCHKHHLLEKDLYQMVLHRPVEPAAIIGMWHFSHTDERILSSAMHH